MSDFEAGREAGEQAATIASLDERLTRVEATLEKILERVTLARGGMAALIAYIPLSSFTATVASAGTGTGGGGDNIGYCLTEDMWLDERMQAKDAEVGQCVAVAPDEPHAPRPEHHHIRAISRSIEDCYRLVTESGAAVRASGSTPMTLRDGSSNQFSQMFGREVRVLRDGRMRWERVIAIGHLGKLPVVRLSLGGRSFFAGEGPAAMVATHNYNKP